MERLTTQIRGQRFSWLQAGTSGPAVVLVHGSPVAGWSFRAQLDLLSAQFRVYAPDLLCFGESEGPEDGAGFDVQSRALADWFDHLDLGRFALAGHDWGGPIAMAAAAGRTDVAQIIIVNATFRPDFAPPWYWGPFVRSWLGRLLVVDLNIVSRRLTTLLHAAQIDEVGDYYRAVLERPCTRRTVLRLEQLDGYRGLMERVDETIDDVPRTSIVWGTPDPYFRRSELDWLRRRLVSAGVWELPGAGHFPQEDDPAAFGEALRQVLA